MFEVFKSDIFSFLTSNLDIFLASEMWVKINKLSKLQIFIK